LKAEDPDQNGEKLVLPFGPKFPEMSDGPNLLPWRAMDVISFGKDYVLRLPPYAGGWSKTEPPENVLCMLVTDKKCYLRSNFVPMSNGSGPCYIELHTGLIHVDGQSFHGGYTRPRGVRAVAIEWEMVTTEAKPRVIFAQRSTQAVTA
jgi:hypothetical protein